MRYPGFRAPASLKQGAKAELLNETVSRYPGFRAPASLKRVIARNNTGAADPLSGVSCPGLIEARLPVVVKKDDISVIRGFVPRPH